MPSQSQMIGECVSFFTFSMLSVYSTVAYSLTASSDEIRYQSPGLGKALASNSQEIFNHIFLIHTRRDC